MSHPHDKSVSGGNSPKQIKTLFMPSEGKMASLVEEKNGKQKARSISFASPQEALSWCIKNKAGFVFFQGTDPSAN